MSPTGDFLATAHVDSLGVYLWSVFIHADPDGFSLLGHSQPGVSAQDQ